MSDEIETEQRREIAALEAENRELRRLKAAVEDADTIPARLRQIVKLGEDISGIASRMSDVLEKDARRAALARAKGGERG